MSISALIASLCGYAGRGRLIALAGIALLLAVGGGTAAPAVVAGHAVKQPADLTGLSLVYLDASRPDVTTMHVAQFDGTDPRRAFNLNPRGQVLALGGPYVAMTLPGTLTVGDLRPGDEHYWSAPLRDDVRSALMLADGTTFYTTGFGCRSTPLGLPQPSRLIRLDPEATTARELAVSANQVFELTAIDSAAGELFVLPRGCDIGIGELQVFSAETGELLRSVMLAGCGRAGVSSNGRTAVAAWQGCTLPERHSGAVATLYDLATGEGRDLTAPTNANVGELRLAPDGAMLAVGGSFGGIIGLPGSTSGAIWLVNTATLDIKPLLEGAGREAFPVEWSPDGRFLLAGSVETQGRCTYQIVEVATGEVRPINPEITVCGANGRILGWTGV